MAPELRKEFKALVFCGAVIDSVFYFRPYILHFASVYRRSPGTYVMKIAGQVIILLISADAFKF